MTDDVDRLRRRQELVDAALALAARLPAFDESGRCPTCRRRRDPKKPMESHLRGCMARAYQVAAERV